MSTNECYENMNLINCEDKKCGPIINFYGFGCCGNGTGNVDGSDNGHSPYIGENGNWFEWSSEANDFVDTGVLAEGRQGETGDQGPVLKDVVITGVETETNQTIDGKTVYQMRVDLGEVAQCITMGVTVTKTFNIPINNAKDVWIDVAQMVASSSRNNINGAYVIGSAVNTPSNYLPRRVYLIVGSVTTNNVELLHGNSVTSLYDDGTIWAIIKYTKTV